MSSKLKSETARTNGAKSRGPVTPEGRATSSNDSIRHGLTAISSVVLPDESREQFQILLDAYIDQFHPATSVEMETVEIMAIARWRLRRIHTIETNLFSTELVRRDEEMADAFTDMDDNHRLAWVFQQLADNGKTTALLIRYEATLNRSYDRAFKQLQILQANRERPQPNEPKPAPAPKPQEPDSQRPVAAALEAETGPQTHNERANLTAHSAPQPDPPLSPAAPVINTR